MWSVIAMLRKILGSFWHMSRVRKCPGMAEMGHFAHEILTGWAK